MNAKMVKRSLQFLSPMINEARKNKIASVVSSRTRSLGVLLENVQDKGNENAIVRSMDAFGVLPLYRVRTTAYPTSKKSLHGYRTDAGAKQWIESSDWTVLDECFHMLKANGYKIASTSPNSSVSVENVDFCEKIVIAFGNEHQGVSKDLQEVSDLHFSLPMCGFVESLNISVCVAVTLYHAYMIRLKRMGYSGDLTEEEQDKLTLQYYMNSIGITENYLLHVMNTSETKD